MPRRKTNQKRTKNRKKLTLERLELRQLLAADLQPAHNFFDPEDVNNDGSVSALDALIVVNEMNAPGTRPAAHFTDVNADGQRSPLDALMVINRINRGGGRDQGPQKNPDGIPTAPEEVRSIDGTGNNLEDPELGSSGEQLLRVAPADYSDGISAPAGEDRPSAREISNALSDHVDEAVPNDRNLSAFLYVWGQFLDHDIDLTTTQAAGTESFDIEVPTGDPYFDPNTTGDQVISLTRSSFDESTGTDSTNPRQQITEITAWIDGSMIYGSDAETAASLREFTGGRLLIGDDGLLPTDENGNFIAGDIRANENLELTSMQTLFVREHNYWADKIGGENPDLSDEEIFQQARAIVIAEIQAITFNEFLPSLLGRNVLSSYDGYDATVNPTIANEFSTAAFRFGHSTINEDVEFFGNDGRAVRDEVELREAFFNPALLQETGIDSILKYVASSQSEEIDLQVVDSLRNFLFGAPGQGGLDLASLNIQRGRDHGLADYNAVREAYGLPRVESFEEITSDPEVQQTLAELYGTVDNIDLWVGGLAEDHAPGSSLGETFQRIVADQFERLRDGDRLWYENVFSGRELRMIDQTRLSDILQRNTTITNLQDNVFFFRAEVQGQVFADSNGDGILNRRETGISGVTVELLNDDGDVVATTKTDRNGRYRFSEFRETGDYQVRVAASSTLGNTTDLVQDVLISRGNQRLLGIDLGVSVLDLLAEDVVNARRNPRPIA
ncbi:MAG: carboxypeptidase regulatory-like domain-containing protein [Planctomycetaceae bacterium]|nr:carboxypeptidase regulatory-like domain-containing protein [Planctomycetales bacterium]MCB9921253.1 carboxypeptidase regulatory-like domain-containing protein [Planctomycetaceae bacterium]